MGRSDMARPTINDISRLAGVSPTAVSFALNARPGVSQATRDRVLEVADQLGWKRNVAAIALSAGRAQAIGLVIARPTSSFTGERFYMQLIAGIERILTAHSHSLVLLFAESADEELATYRRWHSERRVDGVLLTDPHIGDARAAMLDEEGLPYVYLGAQTGMDLPGVMVDDAAAMRRLVDHFAELGHRRLAHVPGDVHLLHTQRRLDEFGRRCTELGIVACHVAATDYTEAAGRAATAALLALAEPPTGITYDNEVLTMGGLAAIASAGATVPGDVAIASFEDSPMCRVVQPPITALTRDPAQLGADATELLLEVVAGAAPRQLVEPTMALEVRESTAAPRV